MFFVVKRCIDLGVDINTLISLTGDKKWLCVDKECFNKEEFEQEYISNNIKKYDETRWFNADNELFRLGGKTYVFSNQHGGEIYKTIINIFEEFSNIDGKICKYGE